MAPPTFAPILRRPRARARRGHIEPALRIYVNRNLRMRNVHMIGFDMDYTLALYDKLMLENLAFEATRDKLMAELHYPEGIAGCATTRSASSAASWSTSGWATSSRSTSTAM